MNLDKIRAILKLLRPVGWVPFFFGLSLGLYDVGASDPVVLAKAFLAVGPIFLGCVYVINFYFDREADKLNPMVKDLRMSTQPFSTGEISPRMGFLLVLLLLFAGVLTLQGMGTAFLALAFTLLLLGVLYSVPPLRLKGRPGFDVATNTIAVGPVCYGIGWATASSIYNVPLATPLWLALFGAPMYFVTLAIDYEADVRTNVTTTAVFLGLKRTLKIGLILLCLSFGFLVLVAFGQAPNLLYLIMLVVFYPLGIYGYWKLYRAASPKKARVLAKRAIQSTIIMIALALILTRVLGR